MTEGRKLALQIINYPVDLAILSSGN